MILLLALLAVFLWLGLTAREFDRTTKRRLVGLIGMIVVVGFFRGIV